MAPTFNPTLKTVELVNINNFKYLGLWISYRKFSIEEKYTIGYARGCFTQHHKFLQKHI